MRDKLFCATFSFALIIFFPLNLRCHFVISIYQYSRNFSSKFSSDFIASIHVSISQHLFLPFAQRREFWNRTSFGATLTLKPYFQPVMTARQAIFNLQDFEIRNALRTVRRFPNILANPNFKKNVHVRSSKNSSEYSQRSIIYPYINRNRANRIIYNPIAITQQFDEKRWSQHRERNNALTVDCGCRVVAVFISPSAFSGKRHDGCDGKNAADSATRSRAAHSYITIANSA